MWHLNHGDVHFAVRIEIGDSDGIEPPIGQSDRQGNGKVFQPTFTDPVNRNRSPFRKGRSNKNDFIQPIAIDIGETRREVFKDILVPTRRPVPGRRATGP